MIHDNHLEVKIDTKEKMHVITLKDQVLAANMTESLKNLLLPYLDKPVKNVVINLAKVNAIELSFAVEMITLQMSFYEHNASMVFCNVSKEIQKELDTHDLLDAANITPTESEAWDIVQMEEIERELF